MSKSAYLEGSIMKTHSIIVGSKIIFMLLLFFGITVAAAEVKVLSAIAMQPIWKTLVGTSSARPDTRRLSRSTIPARL
jgi:hypothetical protein